MEATDGKAAESFIRYEFIVLVDANLYLLGI